MAETVLLEYRGPLAIITLNNPQKLNAQSKDGFYQLAKYLREIAAREEILVTLLTGVGRYFSAGADISVSRITPPGTDIFRHGLQHTLSNNLNVTRAFYTHPKILATALNGPAIGLAAALISFSDFIYCVPSTFIMTPFSSLGLVAEGGASYGFVQRMGISKANEALIQSQRIPAEELLRVGFVNEIFPADGFMDRVLNEIENRMGSHLVGSSMLKIKALIRQRQLREMDQQNVAELFEGLDRQVQGIPQREFEKMRKGQKRHKL
ncbi:ClpP/crotonase-like domain-containing protein [Xylogone sp. PMI_703]|nr:ClpP/crotonase-like domain-containing protein [Xylogone sp. PMI_703]